jgi:hypothetical protein
MFVDTYIYEMDRAGKRVDLSAYLPFLKELIVYTKETSPTQLRYYGRFGQGDPARFCRGSVCSAFPPEAE